MRKLMDQQKRGVRTDAAMGMLVGNITLPAPYAPDGKTISFGCFKKSARQSTVGKLSDLVGKRGNGE